VRVSAEWVLSASAALEWVVVNRVAMKWAVVTSAATEVLLSRRLPSRD
jgi:hypothetical protein